MKRSERAVLSGELHSLLVTLGEKLLQGRNVRREIAAVLPLLLALPPAVVVQAENEIFEAAQLYQWSPRQTWLTSLFHRNERAQLEKHKGLEYLFLFHRNGYLRQAALDRIDGEINSPFIVAAIAWRLNDWVRPVREAASRCVNRAFAESAGEVIAAAAIALLARREGWGRWGQERVLLDEVFNRQDVSHALAKSLLIMRSGRMAAIMRQALRCDGLDPHLEILAREALNSNVRAVALQTLIYGLASWPDGYERQWIDKSMSLYRRVVRLRHRPLTRQVSAEPFIRIAAGDPSSQVRKIALDALIRGRADDRTAVEIARSLADDRYPSVRERAEFILKRAGL